MSTLKVGTIQDPSNSNTAISIDSAGRILTPARPYFRVGMTTSQTGISNGNVIFDTVKDNIGGHYSTSNGRFTAPIAGVYQFGHSVLFQDVANSDDGITLHYYKNGGGDTESWLFDRAQGEDANGYSGSGGYLNSRGSGTITLAVGDYVNLNVYTSGSIGVHGNSNASWSQWYGYLIG